jgi:hypothetical protein
MAHSWNPSTGELEALESQVPGQPKLQGKPLSQKTNKTGPVAHTYNFSYQEGRHWEDHSSRPVWSKILQDLMATQKNFIFLSVK